MIVFWVVMPCGLVGGWMKIEAAWSFKTLVPTYKFTQHHNPDHHQFFTTIRTSNLIYSALYWHGYTQL
jgi:hypothetical protein